MSKLTRSDWSTGDFIAYFSTLGIRHWKSLATLLDIEPNEVSRYVRGRDPIPEHIKQRMLALHPSHPAVTPYQNLEAFRLKRGNRLYALEELPLPPYLMTRSQFMLVVEALRTWHAAIIGRAQNSGQESVLKKLNHELVVCRVIAARLPRHLPYRVHISTHEWPTISSALLHAGGKHRCFYQTWRKNRYTGSPGDQKYCREWWAINRLNKQERT